MTHYLNPVILNPSNAEATFVQSTKVKRILKIIQTLSCWYSFKIALAENSDFENHLNPAMVVFIRKLSPRTLIWVPYARV